MATTSKKTVPCRIPTFSTRIPQASAIPPPPPVAEPAHAPTVSEVTAKHLGKRVCVGEKAGVLKYFGTVHFAKGSWCGIELTNAIGKHDGTVDGVRYFTCPKHHGLMAPLAKVTLVANSCESHLNEDNASGPYSILCLEPKLPTNKFKDNRLDNKNNFRYNKSPRNNLNQLDSAETTYCRSNQEKDNQNSSHNGAIPKKIDQPCSNPSETITIDNLGPYKTSDRRCTFDIQNNTKSAEDFRRFVLKERSPNRNCSNASLNSIGSLPDDVGQFKNSTFKFKSTENICGSQFFDPIEESLLNACNNLTHSAEDLNRTYLNKTLTNHTREINTSPTTPEEELANTYIKSDKNCVNRNNVKEIFQLKEETVSYLANLKRTNDRQNENDYNTEEIKNPFKAPLARDSINKSCEYILNESTLEVKRRRTSNPKCHKPETNPQKNLTYDKPNSLPRLRSSLHSNETVSPRNSLLNLKLFQYSTPIRPDFFDDLAKLRFSDIKPHQDRDDDSNKRDSLECEESLGILTPDQMADFSQTRSPSLEYNPLLENPRVIGDEKDLRLPSPNQEKLNVSPIPNRNLTVNTSRVRENKEEVQSPNLTSEPSLSIIDVDQMLSGFTRYGADTTMNLDLPLDSVANNNKDFVLTRGDQTPSPEELPLDTTPIVESEPSKTESTAKSKTSNSFITSITSITSLDTGYQGDGEMSRPASRGADNSPLTRRPFPRPQPRRPDPMTDSDFYTESDADNHDDNQLKGDRRAQVIDGTLYGVDPQAAADIYVNNRENMDSSGIFTDIESGTRNDDESEGNQKPEDSVEHVNNVNNQTVIDVSPSESTKTISENSQNNIQEILHQKNTSETSKLIETSLDKTINKENPKKRNAPSPGISSPSSLSSPRHHHSREENAAKKYKMPKRDVTSKIKAMMEQYPATPAGEKKVIKKPVNKWDAVMNKISKNEQNKTNLKEVKSKVFIGVNKSSSATPKANEQKKPTAEPVLSQSNKSRRIRTRTVHNPSPLKSLVGNNIESSIHSSLSDLSASPAPTKKLPGSAKKRDAIKVTQVLTPNKLTPKNTKTLTEKSSKPTVKGGRTSPSVRPPAPQTPRAPIKRASPSPRTVEALAVLVQHLVFNVEAYQVPHLKRQVEKFRLESEEVRLAYQHLEETVADEKVKHAAAIEEERVRCRKDITDLIEKHRNQIAQLTSQHADGEQQLILEKETAQHNLNKQHEEQLAILRQELEKLQRSHEESLDILREENDSVREQIDEKRMELEKFNHESLKLKHDYECKEMKLKEEVEIMKNQRDKFKIQIERLENDFEEKLKSLMEENKRLREDNDRLLNYGDDKDIGLQEVQSLRVVLELKLNEVAELRKTLEQTKQKLENLVGAEEKASALQARCEDLQHQLQRKSEYEHTLIQENQKLSESFKEEINQKKRLSQYNEELQWKLKQNKEVMTKVMEQAEESMFIRSNIYSSSFNEKHNASKLSLERTLSFRESPYNNQSSISLDGSSRGRKSKNLIEFDEDLSPPSSPKVKGVVEKSDSVSYVLDLDESPEVVASRIVRRSFRNTTPPKNTPTKSPSNKRPRIRNPLSMSASSSSILSSNKEECERPRSASARNDHRDVDVFLWSNNQSSPKSYKFSQSTESTPSSLKLDDNLELDEFNEADLPLPALPNEMDKRNGVLALPSPRRLAGDATDSNSEDESTSSSQL